MRPMPMCGPKQPWTEDDLATLKSMYECWPVDYGRMPHRPQGAIQTKAHRLGLTNRSQVSSGFDKISDGDWAYLAGFFDGEGTVYDNPIRKNKRCRYNQALVHVANTDLPVMEWIFATWPGANWSVRLPQVTLTGNFTKLLYRVRWTRRDLVLEILTGMLPHLRVKRQGALRVIEALT